MVADQTQGCLFIEGIDRQQRQPVLLLAQIEPCRGHDPQPVRSHSPRQRGQLGRGEQLRFGDVIEQEQRGGPLVRVRLLDGRRASLQMLQHPASQQDRIVLLGLGRCELQCSFPREVPNQRQQLCLPFRGQTPQSGGIAIGKPVGIRHRQLRLSLPPKSLHRRHDADHTMAQLFMQRTQLLMPPHKVRVLPAKIPRHPGRSPGALQPLPQTLSQLRHPSPDFFVLKLPHSAGKPRPDVGEVPAQQFIEPLRIQLFVGSGHLDKVDRGDAVGAHQLVDLPPDVLLPLPAAVLAGEVIWREADEQDLGCLQPPEDAVPPVVHVADVIFVEKDPQRLCAELAMIRQDLIA